MKMTFNRNLLVGFGLSLALLILSSAAALVSISAYKTSAGWVSHTQEVNQNLEKVISTLKDAETGQRGYLLTNDETFLAPYVGAKERSLYYLNKVRDLTIDNPQQTVSCDFLRPIIENRYKYLASVLNDKQKGLPIDMAQIRFGKQFMDQARDTISRMERRESTLLLTRTQTQAEYGKATPVIIIIAAIIAIIITLYFYSRVRNDFAVRAALQKELEDKDKDISRRISIIENVAAKISGGHYDVRTSDGGQDGLGSLSENLNKMAESLQFSFNEIADREWMQSGVRRLAESLLGVQDIKLLAKNITDIVAQQTGSQIAAFYLAGEDGRLHLKAHHALPAGLHVATITPGEGLAGQCLASAATITLKDASAGGWVLKTAAGDLHAKSVIAIPMIHEQHVKGVVELASVNVYTERQIRFLEAISSQTGIIIHTLQANTRVQDLLHETQAQSEEMQMQHSELENINAELEAQSQKLQASEEELRVQQEELMQANSELEERAHLLEERNNEIAMRTRELQEKATALEQSTKYKSEFLANMSHELRTPLNSILLLSRLMSDNAGGNLTKDQVEYAGVIQSAGKGLLSLIDEILDLSKIEAGKMDLEYEDVPLAEIAGNMQDLFSPVARDKGVELRISLADDLPDSMETDEMRLEQILKNLLSNALKFTARGSVSLRIEMSGGNEVRFVVQDTGIGIAAEKQEVIFGAFQQEDGSTQRKYGGTGLGLAISKELARLLGGGITLESEEGKGSVFTLTHPLTKPSEEAGPAFAVTPATIPAPVSAVATTMPKDPKFLSAGIPAALEDDRNILEKGDTVVLIVEDDTHFATSLLAFTRKRGYKGIVAVRGDEGLALAKQYLPTAILLDIELPVMDGWDVMHELKSGMSTRHIPVHIMSSHKGVGRKSMQEGAVNFSEKPVAPEDINNIFAKLETVLKRDTKKVLILEENSKHATALASYLQGFNITPEVARSMEESVRLLGQEDIDCVILDMGIPDKQAYEVLETIKKTPGLENLPVIIYTGKALSRPEEERIRQYADSIVVKTAHSYQRMLDEVSLFLHLMESTGKTETKRPRKLGDMADVLKDKTVLIVDDDVRNIYSLTKALEQHGVNVKAATDGQDALEQLAVNPDTNLVLMDMMMPEMDGYEATAAIRRNPSTKDLPVIAVTAKAMTGDRQRCMDAGASDYITKPVDIDQLLSLLRVWLYENSTRN